jgi:hypothetical protein
MLIMRLLVGLALALGCGLGCASAQILPQVPDLQNRIPAPLPPPPEPPIINGPLTRAPAPGPQMQRRLDSHGDRTSRCLLQGSGAGLRGAELDTYTAACANDQ